MTTSAANGLFLVLRLRALLTPGLVLAAGGLLDVESLRAARILDDGGAQTVDEAIAKVAGSVRENIQLRRAYRRALNGTLHEPEAEFMEVVAATAADSCTETQSLKYQQL